MVWKEFRRVLEPVAERMTFSPCSWEEAEELPRREKHVLSLLPGGLTAPLLMCIMETLSIWRLIDKEFARHAMESEDLMLQQYRPAQAAREGE